MVGRVPLCSEGRWREVGEGREGGIKEAREREREQSEREHRERERAE